MKILIFTTQFYLLSGAERLAIELAEELNKRGIHADVLSMYTEDLPGVAKKKNELLRKGIPNVYFLGLRVHPSPISLLKAIYNLNRLIRKKHYDIIETSSLTPTVIASWGLRGTVSRHLTGIHQVFLINRDNSKQHKVLRWSVSCNRKIRYYSVSDYAIAHWLSYSGTPPEYSRRVYNAIPDDCFKACPNRASLQHEFCLPDHARIILYVGRLVAYKRPDLILDALSTFCETENLTILFVGRADLTEEGTIKMLQRMDQQIACENLSHRVKFLGNSSNVPQIMASADLLVHPTQMEAFGLVLVEAMAAGLQVVSTNVEGIQEVLRETDSLMVPPDDPIALREAVLKTLNRSPVESAQAIEKGRKRAESFRTDERTKQMIKLFEDVLSNQF